MSPAENLVARWRHPVGTQVAYRRDDGTTVSTRTRSAPQVLTGHTAVIWLEGLAGCVALHRVEVVVEVANG